MLLVLGGCTSGESNKKKNSFNLDGSFNGGNKALVFEFGDDTPPSRVFDGGRQPFNIRLLVENQGEFDLAEGVGHVSLSGFNPADFGVTEISKAIPALRAVKKQGDNVIPGGKQTVIFSGLKYMEELPSGVHTQTMYANLCYPYETKSLISMCINGNTLQAYDSDGEICQINEKKAYANSGAPIVIENVEEYSAGSTKVQIKFDIVHKGLSAEGRVYRSGSLDTNCKIRGNGITSTEAVLDENYVTYTVDSGIPGINCESTGTNTNTVLLSSKKATVYCTQDTVGQEEYEKPVTVTLNYDYFDRKPVTIQIEHINS